MLRENGMLGDDRTVNTLNTAKKSAEGAARAIQEKSAALWREELEREKRDVATGLMRRAGSIARRGGFWGSSHPDMVCL